jgi:release factor glutamine methyltransferase
LDMGSGSGAIGVVAASEGAIVTACDINPRAVDLTRENLSRNDLHAEVVQSDLFSALGGRVFDLICFNLPFYAGEPRTPFEAALYGGKGLATVRAFASGCSICLAPKGHVVVVFSEDANRVEILSHFEDSGLTAIDERIAFRWLERFHVVTFAAGRGNADVPAPP